MRTAHRRLRVAGDSGVTTAQHSAAAGKDTDPVFPSWRKAAQKPGALRCLPCRSPDYAQAGSSWDPPFGERWRPKVSFKAVIHAVYPTGY